MSNRIELESALAAAYDTQLGEMLTKQVRTGGERPSGEGGRLREDPQHPASRPSPYTLAHDEARVAALDDACGVNLPEVE